MRASGKDIVEFFGYRPDDLSSKALAHWRKRVCPFVAGPCTKTSHDRSVVYGVCSVAQGTAGSEPVIACPKRLYANQYRVLARICDMAWPKPARKLVVGGSVKELRRKALRSPNPAVALGQGSGKEIVISSNGRLGMDWIIQTYTRRTGAGLRANRFVGVEVQSIDITGNYRRNWSAYTALKEGKRPARIPNSCHGLNWANVHKRIIPQIIRKGNVYANSSRCDGFFLVIPEAVFQRFEQVVGNLQDQSRPHRKHLTVMTYELAQATRTGHPRALIQVREAHYQLEDFALAFISSATPSTADDLDAILRDVI